MNDKYVEVSGCLSSLKIEKKWQKGDLYHHITIDNDHKSSLTLFHVFVPRKLSHILKKGERVDLGLTKSGRLWALYFAKPSKGLLEQAVYELRESILDFRKQFPHSNVSGMAEQKNLLLLLLIPFFFVCTFTSLFINSLWPEKLSFILLFLTSFSSSILAAYYALSYRGLWSNLPRIEDLKNRVEVRRREFIQSTSPTEKKVA